jgi:hypothetical protein
MPNEPQTTLTGPNNMIRRPRSTTIHEASPQTATMGGHQN